MKSSVFLLLAAVLVAQILAKPTDTADAAGADKKVAATADAASKAVAKGKEEVGDATKGAMDKLKKAEGSGPGEMLGKMKEMGKKIPFFSKIFDDNSKAFMPQTMKNLKKSCESSMAAWL